MVQGSVVWQEGGDLGSIAEERESGREDKLRRVSGRENNARSVARVPGADTGGR